MDIVDWARIHLLILQRSYPIRFAAHHDIIWYVEVLHCANVTCFSALDLTNRYQNVPIDNDDGANFACQYEIGPTWHAALG